MKKIDILWKKNEKIKSNESHCKQSDLLFTQFHSKRYQKSRMLVAWCFNENMCVEVVENKLIALTLKCERYHTKKTDAFLVFYVFPFSFSFIISFRFLFYLFRSSLLFPFRGTHNAKVNWSRVYLRLLLILLWYIHKNTQ